MTRHNSSGFSDDQSAGSHQSLPGFREFCEKSQILNLVYPQNLLEVRSDVSGIPKVEMLPTPEPEPQTSDSWKHVGNGVSIKEIRKMRRGWFDDENHFVKWVLDALENLPDEQFTIDACFETSDANSWGENHMSNHAAKTLKTASKNGTCEVNSNHPAVERMRRRFHHVFNREMFQLRPQWIHELTQAILPEIKRKTLIHFPNDFADVEIMYQAQNTGSNGKANSRPGKNESFLEPIVFQIVLAVVLLAENQRREFERESRVRAEREAALWRERYLETQRLYNEQRCHRVKLEGLYGERSLREEHQRHQSKYLRSQAILDETRVNSSFFTKPNSSSTLPLTPATSPGCHYDSTVCDSCDTSDQEDMLEIATAHSAKRRRRELSPSSSFVLVERPRYRH